MFIECKLCIVDLGKCIAQFFVLIFANRLVRSELVDVVEARKTLWP